jgi:E3 ubiquitin-protein ligase RNF14
VQAPPLPDEVQGANTMPDNRVCSFMTSPVEDALYLMCYDAMMREETFQRETHECQVCLEEVLGKKMLRLDCEHAFCRTCLETHCNLHVTEGSVAQLTCPDCDDPLSAMVVRDIFGFDGFLRWESLVSSKAMDSMEDLTFCPRCKERVVSETATENGHCVHCYFSFCKTCFQSSHPGHLCVSLDERILMVKDRVAKMQQISRKDRFEAELRSLQDLQSETTVRNLSKPCPGCKTQIQKSEGCNKMTCSQCRTFFCYLCGKQIDGYEHFEQGVSRCILFDGQQLVAPICGAPPEALLEVRAAFNAGLTILRCPRCQQNNWKRDNNNRILCWNCRHSFCFLCRAELRKVYARVYVCACLFVYVCVCLCCSTITNLMLVFSSPLRASTTLPMAAVHSTADWVAGAWPLSDCPF